MVNFINYKIFGIVIDDDSKSHYEEITNELKKLNIRYEHKVSCKEISGNLIYKQCFKCRTDENSYDEFIEFAYDLPYYITIINE